MIRTALLAVPLALFVGCGDDDKSGDGTRSPLAASAPASKEGDGRAAASAGTKIVLGRSQFGRILFDSKRQAIYLFDKETTRRPRCYGECAKAWPPVYANGAPRVGNGLDRELLGTVKRRDGKKQVTYGGHPLYFYAHEGPGQVLCHDVEEFGGLWLVVKRSGDPVPSSR